MILMWYNTQTYFRKIILQKWWSQRQFIFNFSRDVCWIVNFKDLTFMCGSLLRSFATYDRQSQNDRNLTRYGKNTPVIIKWRSWASCIDTSDHKKPAVLEQASEKTSGRAIRRSLGRNQSSFHTDQQTFQELSLLNFFHNYIQKQILLSNPIKDFSFSCKQPWSDEMQKSEICNLANEGQWNEMITRNPQLTNAKNLKLINTKTCLRSCAALRAVIF